jgi:hypothetical protein
MADNSIENTLLSFLIFFRKESGQGKTSFGALKKKRIL